MIPREAMADVVAACFEKLAAAGTFTPDGGDPVAVRVGLGIQDFIETSFAGMRVLQTGRVLELQTALVTERPKRGDTIEVAPGDTLSGVYTVTEEATSTDRYQLIWRCPVGEPEA